MKYRIFMGMLWLSGGALLIGIVLAVYAITHAHTPDESIWSVRGASAELARLLAQYGMDLGVLLCAVTAYGALLCPWPGTPHARTIERMQRAERLRCTFRRGSVDWTRIPEIVAWMAVFMTVALWLSAAPLWYRFPMASLLAYMAKEGVRFLHFLRLHRRRHRMADRLSSR